MQHAEADRLAGLALYRYALEPPVVVTQDEVVLIEPALLDVIPYQQRQQARIGRRKTGCAEEPAAQSAHLHPAVAQRQPPILGHIVPDRQRLPDGFEVRGAVTGRQSGEKAITARPSY